MFGKNVAKKHVFKFIYILTSYFFYYKHIKKSTKNFQNICLIIVEVLSFRLKWKHKKLRTEKNEFKYFHLKGQ